MSKENRNQNQPQGGRRAITDPKQIALLMMSKENAINEAKDNLTLTIRSLMDSANQIVQAYGDEVTENDALKAQVKKLQEKTKSLEASMNNAIEKKPGLGKSQPADDGKEKNDAAS